MFCIYHFYVTVIIKILKYNMYTNLLIITDDGKLLEEISENMNKKSPSPLCKRINLKGKIICAPESISKDFNNKRTNDSISYIFRY